jgi:F0F1-type ATP synthase delta subunit
VDDDLCLDLICVQEVFDRIPDLDRLLSHPAIIDEEKIAIFEKVFSGKIDDRVYNFLLTILKRRRISLLH